MGEEIDEVLHSLYALGGSLLYCFLLLHFWEPHKFHCHFLIFQIEWMVLGGKTKESKCHGRKKKKKEWVVDLVGKEENEMGRWGI